MEDKLKKEEKEKCCCHAQSKASDGKKECCHSKEQQQTEKHGEQHSCCHGEGKQQTKKHSEQHSCCHGASEGGGQSHRGCCGTEKTASKKTQIIILIISFAALVVSFIAPFKHHSVLKYLDFGWIAVLLCGVSIVKGGFKSLFKGKVTSELLISLSMFACITLEILSFTGVLGDGHGHSNIFAAGEVAWLMYLGGMIEEFTVGKARQGIERLVSLKPTTARYRDGDGFIMRPLTEVAVGDIVTVLPNDMISVDGVIVSGATAADESVMTGESIPVDKAVGDVVFGGTWNQSGAIDVKVTKTSDEMAVQKLKNLVLEAEGKRAPISKLADRWAGYIVPAAIGLAIIVFLVAFFALNASLATSIERGVTMLVVFCPCALALATPTAIAAGLGNATKRGILIRSGAALEMMAAVKNVAFDKTGTLTQGKLSVTDIIPVNCSIDELKANAGAVERYSQHPIAKAIVNSCSSGKDFTEAESVESLTGTGIKATVNGAQINALKWSDAESELIKNGEKIDEQIAVSNRLMGEGKTVVGVIKNGSIIGIIALADTIKENAAYAVEGLKALKIESHMLTGDNKNSAQNIAAQTGITSVFSALLPADKLQKIDELKKQGKVCMVGDGVNDAPALATADCSIAMAALGSDVAVETADVAIMGSDVGKVAGLFALSRRTLFTIKINIIISLLISFTAVFLSMFGILNPITGALVHNISSVLVVTNSALILRKKDKRLTLNEGKKV